MDTLKFIALHSILSYDLRFSPQGIISRYALTIKQTTKIDFRKRTRYTKINLNDQATFQNIFQIFFSGNKTWNDKNNYFILRVDIQLQLGLNAEYLKVFFEIQETCQKII